MLIQLTEEQKMLRDMAREFTQRSGGCDGLQRGCCKMEPRHNMWVY